MSPRFILQQRKIRLLAVFLFTLALVLAFQFYQSLSRRPGDRAVDAQEHLFIGLRHAQPEEVMAVLPETSDRPVLLTFGSKMCYECRRMEPVLASLMKRHPGVLFRKVDVLEDQSQYAGLLRAFKPVSVPVLVMITPGGRIQNVLYNAQGPLPLAAALSHLEAESRPPSGKKAGTGKTTG